MCDGNCFECKYDDCIASDKEVLEFAKEETRKNVEEIAMQPITKRNPLLHKSLEVTQTIPLDHCSKIWEDSPYKKSR